MFLEPLSGDARSVWSSTDAGRGKRPYEVKVGCYVIEHIATGNLFTGHSKAVSKDIDKQIKQLHAGKHPNHKLTSIFKLDHDLKLYEYPTKSLTKAKALEKEIRESVKPKYLLRN
jgi:hypothetical protein